jgi:tryptophan-rich sensory protein
MDPDVRRQVVNIIAYVITLAVDLAAVLLPLNGLTTAQISDRFPVLVTPDDYVFGIWSVIYVLLALFVVYQALPGRRRDPDLRAIGYLPALTGVFNTAWIVAWHYELFSLTIPIMLALLGTLVVIHGRLRTARALGGAGRWLVALPFSVYLGWITVATIANISAMLYGAGYRGEPIGEGAWAAIVLAAGVGIAAAMLLRERDWAFGLVIIWAYVGIAVGQDDAAAVASAIVGAAAVAMLMGWLLLRARAAPPAQTAASSA